MEFTDRNYTAGIIEQEQYRRNYKKGIILRELDGEIYIIGIMQVVFSTDKRGNHFIKHKERQGLLNR
jgi:hypothetical protein